MNLNRKGESKNRSQHDENRKFCPWNEMKEIQFLHLGTIK